MDEEKFWESYEEESGEGLEKNTTLKSMRDHARRVGRLSREEEQELLNRLPDEDAVKKLTDHNMELIIKLAQPWRNDRYPFDDILQEAVIGFTEGCRKFKTSFNTRLSTYVSFYIKKRIINYFQTQSPFCVATSAAEKLQKVRKARENAELEGKTRLSREELAERTGLDEYEILDALELEADMNLRYLDAAAGTEDDCGSALCEIEAGSALSPEDEYFCRCADDNMEELLSTLEDSERTLITLRFGLEDGNIRGLEETAKILGCSVQEVRNRERLAIRCLRSCGFEIEELRHPDRPVKAK